MGHQAQQTPSLLLSFMHTHLCVHVCVPMCHRSEVLSSVNHKGIPFRVMLVNTHQLPCDQKLHIYTLT